MLLLSAVIACKLLQLMGIQNKRYSLNANLQLIFLNGTAISLTFHKDVFCVHCRLRLGAILKILKGISSKKVVFQRTSS